MMWLVEIDIEIDPLSLRGQLKFFVASEFLKVRADKSLRDIPIPKLIRFCRGVGLCLQIKFFIGTDEKNVEILLRPARPNFCSIFRKELPVGICLHVGGLRAAPKRGLRICVELRIGDGPCASHRGISSEGDSAPSNQ